MQGPFENSGGSQRGFTLVELLLSVALTAIVAALAYAGLNSGAVAASAMGREAAAVIQLQQALSMIEEDLTAVLPRPLQLGVGYREAAFVSGVDGKVLLTFTRGGVQVPDRLLRSDLLRVRYVLQEGVLWRDYWPQVDRMEVQQQPQHVRLLTGINAIQLEYLPAVATRADFSLSTVQANGAPWLRNWNSDAPGQALTDSLPQAIRLSIDTHEFGQVQRVVLLP